MVLHLTVQAHVAPILNNIPLDPLSADVGLNQVLDPSPDCINAAFHALRLLLSKERHEYSKTLGPQVERGELHPAEAEAIKQQLSAQAVRDLTGALHQTVLATLNSLSSSLDASLAEQEALQCEVAALRARQLGCTAADKSA